MNKETKSSLLETIKDAAKRDFGETVVNVTLFIPCEEVERDEHLIPTLVEQSGFEKTCKIFL